jgi:glycine cleavage system transcriptional repressor
MTSQLLVCAVGDDRPGIVASLTEVVARHGGNLEESRMALLGGEFAAIMLISMPPAQIDKLKDELKKLNDNSINIVVKPTHKLDPHRFKGHSYYDITLNGADHEGIVHKVSSLLHGRGINIQSMDTDVVNAPETGIPLFRMKAIVAVPGSVELHALEADLSKVGNQENVEITVRQRSEQAIRILV